MKQKKIFIIIIISITVILLGVMLFPFKNIEIKLKKVKKTITIEEKRDRETKWTIKWYSYDNTGYNEYIGEEEFPATFSYNWGKENLFGGYNNYVRLEAESEINVPRDGLYFITLGADDGIKLLIDDKLVSSYQWEYGGSYGSKKININLKKGKHKLKLYYYEKYANAAIYFYCSPELLSWSEIISISKDTIIIESDTSTIYTNLFIKMIN